MILMVPSNLRYSIKKVKTIFLQEKFLYKESRQSKLDPCLIFGGKQNVQRNYYCLIQCLMIVKASEFSPPEKLATSKEEVRENRCVSLQLWHFEQDMKGSCIQLFRMPNSTEVQSTVPLGGKIALVSCLMAPCLFVRQHFLCPNEFL